MKIVFEIPIEDLMHMLRLMQGYFNVKVKKVKRSVVDEKKYLVTLIVKDFNIFEELIHILSYNKLLRNVVIIDVDGGYS